MRNVVLSKTAELKLERLLEYLEVNWSPKAKTDFLFKLDRSFSHIQKYPESCPKTEAVRGLHMLVVTRQTSVFYRFDSKSIFVVTIFDNRMDPEKLKEEAQ